MTDIEQLRLVREDCLCLPADCPADKAIDAFLAATEARDTPAVAVVTSRNGRFVGLFTWRNALQYLDDDPEADTRVTLEAISTLDIPVAAPSDSLAQIIAKALSSKADAIPVIKDGRVLGVITHGDLFDRVFEEALIGSEFLPEE